MLPFDRHVTPAGWAVLAEAGLYHAAITVMHAVGSRCRPIPPLACLALALPVLYWGLPASSPVSGSGQLQFSSGVQLVEVFATVTNARGEPVTGLTASDFVLREDGVVQPVSVLVEGEFPLTVALGIDRSWSMAGEPLRQAKAASRAFLAALRPEDRAMVIGISAEPEVVATLSASRVEQERAIADLDPWSTTALRDALISALDAIESEPGRLAVVVFSDGVDRYSRATPPQVLARARRSRALIYPIHVGRSERAGLLDEVAAVTGGRSFHALAPSQLTSVLEAVADELRHQYLIGYEPTRAPAAGAGEWRSVRVSTTGARGDLRVRARAGYVAQ